MSEPAVSSPPPVKPQLGFWDAISIIVGIVIGVTIYQMPPVIAGKLTSPTAVLGAWALGGVLSLAGALCYAELATTYPRLGGDYVYLSRAYGSWAGFLFGWAQLAVICTGNIGQMAFVFGEYAERLTGRIEMAGWFALAVVVGLSLLNILGVVVGKQAQNLLSILKIVGLAAILVAGLSFGQGLERGLAPPATPTEPNFGLTMVFILYGYGGWNDAAFVAAEVRDRRNIARSLVIGIALITVIYLAVNLAYFTALGFDGVRHSSAVASDVFEPVLGQFGARLMAALVMISALGAANGLIYTGSRVFSALGTGHRAFALLARWHPRLGTPIWSLLIQGAVSAGFIGLVGTDVGRGLVDFAFALVGRPPVAWNRFSGGFDALLAATAPVFWLFFLLTGVAFFVLRVHDRTMPRPFALAVPWFPLLPLLFCGTCLYMLYTAVLYAGDLTAIGALAVLAGLPLYAWSSRRQPAS